MNGLRVVAFAGAVLLLLGAALNQMAGYDLAARLFAVLGVLVIIGCVISGMGLDALAWLALRMRERQAEQSSTHDLCDECKRLRPLAALMRMGNDLICGGCRLRRLHARARAERGSEVA